jgi:hypothetical protein
MNATVNPAPIQTDLGAIFVSLELSRSTWLVTSLSPASGEKMSKFSVIAGDAADLLSRMSFGIRPCTEQGVLTRSSQSRRPVWMASGSIVC